MYMAYYMNKYYKIIVQQCLITQTNKRILLAWYKVEIKIALSCFKFHLEHNIFVH